LVVEGATEGGRAPTEELPLLIEVLGR